MKNNSSLYAFLLVLFLCVSCRSPNNTDPRLSAYAGFTPPELNAYWRPAHIQDLIRKRSTDLRLGLSIAEVKTLLGNPHKEGRWYTPHCLTLRDVLGLPVHGEHIGTIFQYWLRWNCPNTEYLILYFDLKGQLVRWEGQLNGQFLHEP